MSHENVKFLRLTTGDDVISEIVEIEESGILQYQLINPLKVLYLTGGKNGYIQVAFAPWVFNRICKKQEFTLKENNVIMVSDVTESMIEYYFETIDQFDDAQKEKESVKFTEEEYEGAEEELEALKEMIEQLKQNKGTFH